MAQPRRRPDDQTLRAWLAEGITYKEMTERWFEKTGLEVSEGAISVYLARHRDRLGFPLRRPRYSDLIPWRVRDAHGRHEALRMLRLEARCRKGEKLPEADLKRLEDWKAFLKEDNLVVDYEPGYHYGFVYVPRQKGDRELIRPPKGEGSSLGSLIGVLV